MSLTTLSSSHLKKLIQLIKNKEILQDKLEAINQEIEALDQGGTTAKRRGRKPGVKVPQGAGRKRGRGSNLKEPLLKALAAAGSQGITVKELSQKLKVKPGNIFSWFYTTGKKIKGISKVGEAKYAYTA